MRARGEEVEAPASLLSGGGVGFSAVDPFRRRGPTRWGSGWEDGGGGAAEVWLEASVSHTTLRGGVESREV